MLLETRLHVPVYTMERLFSVKPVRRATGLVAQAPMLPARSTPRTRNAYVCCGASDRSTDGLVRLVETEVQGPPSVLCCSSNRATPLPTSDADHDRRVVIRPLESARPATSTTPGTPVVGAAGSRTTVVVVTSDQWPLPSRHFAKTVRVPAEALAVVMAFMPAPADEAPAPSASSDHPTVGA